MATADGRARTGAAAWVVEDGDARIVVDPALLAWRDDDGSWSPFFPNAPLLVHERELDAIGGGDYRPPGTAVLGDLRRAGVVEAVTTERALVGEHVAIEWTGAHSPGHQIVRVSDDGDVAVMLGHLALSALHVAAGVHPFSNEEQRALAPRRDEGAVLIGPLWPSPGAGRFEGDHFVALTVSSRA